MFHITGDTACADRLERLGEVVLLELVYKRPRTGKRTQIRQAVRIARDQPFELKIGARASEVCWGVMPSGMLRHPLFLSWA